MNLNHMFFVAYVHLIYYIFPTTCGSHASQCPEVCAEAYKDVFLGVFEELYHLSKDVDFTHKCIYLSFGNLNVGDKTAKASLNFQYQGTVNINKNDTIILTEQGLIFQTYLTSNNNDKYYSAYLNNCGVVVLTECPKTVISIGCKVGNCGTDVQNSAKTLADSFSVAYNLKLVSVKGTDCTNRPY